MMRLEDYTVSGDGAVMHQTDAGMSMVGQLERGWSAEDLFTIINKHGAKLFVSSMPEGVKSEHTLDVSTLYDQCDIGAGAAMSPVGPIGVVRFLFASSAREPDDVTPIDFAGSPELLNDLRQRIVRAFGKAIKEAIAARRLPG